MPTWVTGTRSKQITAGLLWSGRVAAPWPPPAGGFTLLELLVVMFIIGIIAAMATLSVGVSVREKGTDREIERLGDLVALASDEAVLQGREYGLTFYAKQYEFSAFDATRGEWVPFGPGNEPFSPQRFPEDAVADLEVEGQIMRLGAEPEPRPERRGDRAPTEGSREGADSRTERSTYLPQVLILSSGDVTPFGLRLRSGIGGDGTTLRVAADGTMERVPDDS